MSVQPDAVPSASLACITVAWCASVRIVQHVKMENVHDGMCV
jgi:hypothetical protein